MPQKGLLSRPARLGQGLMLSEEELLKRALRRSAEMQGRVRLHGAIRRPRSSFERILEMVAPDPRYESGIFALKTPSQRAREAVDLAGLGPESMRVGPGILGRGAGILGMIIPKRPGKNILSRMNRTLRSKGYDVRGSDDIQKFLDESSHFRTEHPDWLAAYEKAVQGVERATSKKAAKKAFKNIDWKRLRELGTTNDFFEAGYITPKGRLVDLSGKKEGGPPGTRILDHREVGGTVGMQELQKYGYIRMDANSGLLDMAAPPTADQIKQIRKLLDSTYNPMGPRIELSEGLGPLLRHNQYYGEAKRTFNRNYPNEVKSSRIIADIKRFYEGDDPVPYGMGY